MHIPKATSSLNVFFGNQTREGRMLDLPLERIVRNESQPREHFDADALAALAESIQENGVIQPIAVRQVGPERFELIAGERRWLASQRAGIATIPAVVHDVDERTALVLALVENVVREDLNPMETARAYASLLDTHGISVADLARALGRSRPAVANTLRLLELPDDVLAMLERGQLTEGHGRALLGASDRTIQRRFAQRAIDQGWSVRALEAAVRGGEDAPVTELRARTPQTSPELQERVESFAERVLGANARVKMTTRGCRIELRCASPAQLLSLIDRLEALEKQQIPA
jgi:ParB family chromosome partitioning protein